MSAPRSSSCSPASRADAVSWEPDWAQWRALPTDDDVALQSHAHHWLRRIPSSAHPKQLCLHYPRIANRIAACWDDVPATGRLLADLLIDRRGGRAGFPVRVVADILRLHRIHARRLSPPLRQVA